MTDFDLAVQKFQRETGCDVVTAIQHVQGTRPDLAVRHGHEVNAAVERYNGQRATASQIQAFDQLVEQHHQKHGGSFVDSLTAVAGSHRDLALARTRALSIPIGPGGVTPADR